MPERILIVCDCGNRAHNIIFETVDDDWPFVYVSVHLNSYLPWWQRLRIGLLWIIGRTRDDAHYDSIIISRDQNLQLRDWLEAANDKIAKLQQGTP